MRRLTILGFLAALALAQGRQTTDAFYLSGSCGPGYVQRDFVGRVKSDAIEGVAKQPDGAGEEKWTAKRVVN